MTPLHPSRLVKLVWRSIGLRLGVYYAVVLSVTALLWTLFPSIGQAIAEERGYQARGFGDANLPLVGIRGIDASTFADWNLIVVIVASLLGALVFALPVAWVFQWARGRKDYRPDFVQTLLLLPIAIATVVFLVKESLALAFGLAGIVAAIRFRHTLDSTWDAVFLFVVIGIGLAAGAQLLTMAALASMIFNAAVLTFSHLEFGLAARKDGQARNDDKKSGKDDKE